MLHGSIKAGRTFLVTTFLCILPCAQAAAAEGHTTLKHHSIGVIIADSDERNGEDDLTLGLEYEYRFNEKIGTGVVYEHTKNAHHGDGVSVGLLIWRPPISHSFNRQRQLVD